MPGVGDAAVIGIPHERSGEVPKAFVVRAANDAGAGLTADSVSAFVAATLSSYKVRAAS
jgi:long-chain acyl-CoA synthetase